MKEYKYVIPEESMDAISNHVDTWRKIENELRSLFTKYAYQEVLMPSFEYVDLYTKLDSGFVPEKMFQYINHEGKNVAMRCDFTIPLARLYATTKQKGTARYCYFGKVYRKEARHKGRHSEFYQCGVELIDKSGVQGDLECMQMIQESLSKLHLQNVIIELGSAKFFHRLCQLIEDVETFTEILRFRDSSGMKKFVSAHSFSKEINTVLLQLPMTFGDSSVLEELTNTLRDRELLEALEEIRTVYSSLENKENIIFDLGMVPSMKYYTGLMIKGYSDASAYPIISGGRYDRLLPRFDRQVGAIGFCYHMNHILKALEVEGETND